MITTEKAIDSIRKKLEELKIVNNSTNFYPWQLSTISRLEMICPNNSILKSFKDINSVGWKSDLTPDAKRKAITLLNGLIEDLMTFGIENINIGSKEKDDKLSVNVSQHNHQNQTTNVSFNLNHFVEAIKDELKGGQIKELKAILEGDEEPEQKKKSFFDKIKSFGSDVASNILANVLTNSEVLTKIGGLL
jgi:hypothetical protein